ncbi:MAG: TonB-dependent receptor [Pseudomonadota bacterium]
MYRTPVTTSGKLETAQVDSSITITAITDDLIIDQGARDAADIYRNISGVTAFSYSGITARGFRQGDIFFDGLRGDLFPEFVVPQLFNIERVEFVKGPAGMLYGVTPPGGLFNYVTKKPTTNAYREVRLVAGTDSRFGGSLQLEGPAFGNDVGSRVGLFYEDRETSQDNSESETLVFDAGLSFDAGFADLTLQAFYIYQDLPGNRLRGIPTDSDGNFLADPQWNHNESFDFIEVDSTALQARLEGGEGTSWDWDLTVRYNENTEDQAYHESGAPPIDTTGDGELDAIERRYRETITNIESLSLAGNAVYSADLASVQSRTLIGFDYFDGEDIEDFTTTGVVNTLSLRNPLYGQVDPSTYTFEDFGTGSTLLVFDNRQERTGLYALQELTIGNFILTGGLRWDDFEDRTESPFQTLATFSDDRITGRAGVVYKIRDDVSVFAQWAESFEPQGPGNQDPVFGGPFDPTEGENIETGIRTDLFDGRIQSSVAVYQIKRTNLVQSTGIDANNDGFIESVAFGEVTSEGVDLDLTADITPDWVLTLAYAYNETEITEDITGSGGGIGNQNGGTFVNAPRHQLGLWTRYQVQSINTAFALGADYVSERIGFRADKVKPYTVFDASVIHERDDWRFLLRVENLFDETYASSGFAFQFPGDVRTAFLEVYRKL